MGLVETDLDPGVCVSMATIGIPSHTPLEDHPLATHREPSALYCWILEILYEALRKGSLFVLQSERAQGFAADPVYGRAKCLPMLGEIKT